MLVRKYIVNTFGGINPYKILVMKRIVVLSVFILLVTNSFAQLFTVFGREIGFFYAGPKVGMNLSKFSQWSYDTYDTKNRLGYQIGVVGDIGLTRRISFQTELNLISKGTKGVDKVSGFTETKRMPSIQIPLLAKYAFSFMGLKKVYANGGAYSTTRVGSGKIIYQDGYSYDDYHWTRFDWGLSFGCGAEYPMEEGIWGLDLRYDLGFVDIYRQNDENTKSRLRSLQISLTYKFDMVDLLSKKRNDKHDES